MQIWTNINHFDSLEEFKCFFRHFFTKLKDNHYNLRKFDRFF